MVPYPEPPPKPANDVSPDSGSQGLAQALVGESLSRQAAALTDLAACFPAHFAQLVSELLRLKGKLYVMADSGSESFAALAADELSAAGTPSFAVTSSRQKGVVAHALSRKDAVLLISRHATNEGIAHLLPGLQNSGALLIALLRNADSALAKRLKFTLPAAQFGASGQTPSVAAPLQLFGPPLQVLCDALLQERGPREQEDDCPNPLTSRLLLKTGDLMHSERELPRVLPQSTLFEAMARLQKHRLGAVVVASADDDFVAVLSEHDIQTAVLHSTSLQCPVEDLKGKSDAKISVLSPVSDALELMRRSGRDELAVVDDGDRLLGLLTLRDLLT